MATRTAIVEGDRNVLITAPTNNALIVTGDRNTVEMKLDGAGAALAFAFRWNRPKARKRGDRPAPPPRFELHVDRDREVAVLAAAADPPRVVNIYGEPGVGKTHVLVEALNRRECELRDGTVYLDGRGRDADDLLHAVFEALFETRIPLRDQQIERHLKARRAVLALENVDVAPADSQRLALAAPAGRLYLTSSARVLFDGFALRLDGLLPEHGVAIAEQELGRALSGRERAAAVSVCEGLRGHPLQLRQTFGRARDAGLGIDQLAPRAASAYERAQALTAQERNVARVLAVHGGAPLGVEHIEAIAGPGARAIAAQLAARHEARSHSPRYSLPGDLAAALDEGPQLDVEYDHALSHFAEWAQAEARAGRRERVLLEADALVALLERGHARGRHQEVVRLGVAIEGALAWGNRWAAWQRVLELVLAGARANGDLWAEGAALHQLGTRAYGTGDAGEAKRLLEQALERREQIGDRAGAQTTRRNLRVVGGGPPLLYRLSHLPLAIVATIVAVLVIGAGAAIGGDDDVTAQLAVTVSGPGSVASTPAAISCRPRCSAQLDTGTDVLLQPAPDEGAEFRGWSGGGCTGRGRCRLTFEAATTLTARFAALPDPQELSVEVAGQGSVVSTPAAIDCPQACDAGYPRGRTVVLAARRAAGWTFASWSGACARFGSRPRCEVRMEGPRSVAARFDEERGGGGDLRLSVRPAGDGSGRVTGPAGSGLDCTAPCSATFPAGTAAVTLRAAEDEGSVFAGWGDACPGAEGTCAVALAGAETIVRPRFDLKAVEQGLVHLRFRGAELGTVTSDPAGLSCRRECREPFPRGAAVTLTAEADKGSRFVGWRGVAGCRAAPTCVVTVAELTPVTALFARLPRHTLTTRARDAPGVYEIRTSADTDTVGRNCNSGCDYTAGSVIEVTVTADDPVQTWTGCASSTPTTCRLTLTADTTVVADFDIPG